MSQLPSAPPGSPAGMQPHRGTMILVFGILALVTGCIIFGIMAWVMGNGDLAKMRAGQMDPSGEGLTKAGKICGMINVILAIIGLVVTILWLLLFVVIGLGAAGAAAAGGG